MSLSNEPGLTSDQRGAPLLAADVENQVGVDNGEALAEADDKTGLELPPWRPSTGSITPAKNRVSSTMTTRFSSASQSGRASVGSVRGGGKIGRNVEVDVIMSAKEWGAGLGLDSSDESSSDDDKRRKNRRGAPQGERAFEGDTPRDEVGIVEVAGEWACGFSSSDESDSDGEVREKPDRYGRQRTSKRVEIGPESMTSSSSSSSPRESDVRNRSSSFRFKFPKFTEIFTVKLARFVVVGCLSALDFPLQFCTLIVYFIQPNGPSRTVFFLIPIQILGVCISTYLTFHDQDVIDFIGQEKRKRPNWHKFTLLYVFVACGCCHLIQVKRAYKRQIKTAEIITDLDEDDERSCNAAALGHFGGFGGAERAIPVALLTGIPFLLVNTIAFLTANRLWDGTMERVVLISASTVSLLTVSLGILEIDLAVSTYVCKRYHFKLTRATCLFPFVHVLFRSSEVSLRIFFFTAYWLNLERLGKEWIVVCFTLDYLVGFCCLQAYSSTQERPLTHVIMAFLFLVADLSHFVDQPNFTMPARKISRFLTSWRLFEMVALIAVGYFRPNWSNMCMDEVRCDGTPGRTKRAWMFEMQSLVAAFGMYCILLASPPIRKVGHDLHSAAKTGDVKRLTKLLTPDSSNQVLDVNATTKDGTNMTPLHFAAAGGHVEALKKLFSSGADWTKMSNDGDNCLHIAARNCKDKNYVEAIKIICLSKRRRKDLNILNKANKYPKDILPERWKELLKTELNYDQRSATSNFSRTSFRHTSVMSMTGPSGGHENVPIVECANVQLKGLFPDAADDDAPSPRALNSVSGLVFSKAAGGIARKVLKRNEDDMMVSLGALRKVGELGKGGFGKVIEVVMPDRTGGYFSSRSREKRYALKLQTKTGSAAVQQSAFHEVLALRTVHHPFIVRLEKAFATPKFFALLLELCPTDLNRKLFENEDENERYPGLGHKDCARYLGQVLIAIKHMHKINIVYRDLKPENILVSLDDEAKVADFGLAKAVGSADRMTMCGTMGFFPPELLNGDLISDSDEEDDGESKDGSFNIASSSRDAASRLASCRTSRASSNQGSFDPFKLDSYSFGVTLQVCLLGEDGAQKKEIKKKGVMMLPMHMSEEENKEMLATLRDNGKLDPEAYDLLVNMLLPFRPSKRKRLLEEGIEDHEFFLKTLGCENLHEHLLKNR